MDYYIGRMVTGGVVLLLPSNRLYDVLCTCTLYFLAWFYLYLTADVCLIILISKIRPGGPCMNRGSMRSGHTTGTMPCTGVYLVQHQHDRIEHT